MRSAGRIVVCVTVGARVRRIVAVNCGALGNCLVHDLLMASRALLPLDVLVYVLDV